MKWSIIIADDHQLVLNGLARIVQAVGDFTLLTTALDGKSVLELLAAGQIPDVILMDINMPNGNGLETTKKLKSSFPRVKILMLTMHEDSIYQNKALAVGADGLIMKTANQKQLVDALRTICEGNSYFLRKHNTSRRLSVEHEHQDVILTAREIEVLKKIAVGFSNSEIANLLGISIRTVDTHRTHLKKKIGVKGIAGLVRFAYERGLVT